MFVLIKLFDLLFSKIGGAIEVEKNFALTSQTE